jgi:hypothetical protein
MKNFRIALLFACGFFAAGSLALPDQKIQLHKPSVDLFLCPDIEVVSFDALLYSTQVGTPLIEFPTDTVAVYYDLKNSGKAAVPNGTVLNIVFKRNGKVLRSFSITPTARYLGAPDSHSGGGFTDSFPHGEKMTYSVQVTGPIQECTTNNNSASFTIDEDKLHKGQKTPPYPK